MNVPGITLVGTIPAELQLVTVYAAVLTKTAREPEAAAALIHFLASPDAVPAIRRAGLTLPPRR
jgi:molybdate transport system substrate-binding protein